MPEKPSGSINNTNKKRRINIGLIICIIIVLYFVAYFCDFLFNKSKGFFEISPGYTSSSFDGRYNALIIRDESVVNSQSSGYVNFFVGDNTPIYVGQHAYLVDKSGELSAKLRQTAQNKAILNENDLTVLKDSLYNFDTSFDESDFYESYHFKYQIESQILDLVNNSIFNSNEFLYSGNYTIYDSELAGIIMHYVDGFEDVTLDTFDASAFRKMEYDKKIIRSNDYVEADSPVYKVITSEKWYLIIQVNNPDAFKDLDIISIEFLKDNIVSTADFQLAAAGGNYYGIISLDKYMIRYASDRYAQISFTDNTKEGLKVPKTSVTQKQYYAVPSSYLTQGGDSSDQGFLVRRNLGSETGIPVLLFPEIVKTEDGLCYIDPDDLLNEGDVIVKTDSNNEFQVGMTAGIDGVFIYNGAYTIFRFIEILGENDGYYIVSDNTPNGVKVYDQVYIDYNDALGQE